MPGRSEHAALLTPLTASNVLLLDFAACSLGEPICSCQAVWGAAERNSALFSFPGSPDLVPAWMIYEGCVYIALLSLPTSTTSYY